MRFIQEGKIVYKINGSCKITTDMTDIIYNHYFQLVYLKIKMCIWNKKFEGNV